MTHTPFEFCPFHHFHISVFQFAPNLQNLQLHRGGHNLPWKLKQRTSTEIRKQVYVCPKTSVKPTDDRLLFGLLASLVYSALQVIRVWPLFTGDLWLWRRRSTGIWVFNRRRRFWLHRPTTQPSDRTHSLNWSLSHDLTVFLSWFSPSLSYTRKLQFFFRVQRIGESNEVNGLPGLCSGNSIGNQVVFGFKDPTQLIIGSDGLTRTWPANLNCQAYLYGWFPCYLRG